MGDIMARKRKVKKGKVIGILLLLVLLAVMLVFAIKMLFKEKKETPQDEQKEPEVVEPVKKLNIIDEDSDSRNIAVMYNNIATVWGYQSGLQDAYLVYEIIVEGGYTRLMAIFKDADTERIGSVRSSRPYFLDYALENDALYIHYGASNQALKDISSLGVNNINGMYYSKAFWRDKSLGLATEHTAFTSMDKIMSSVEDKGYRTTSDVEPVLNYSVDEIDISTMDGAIPANKIYIEYSYSRSTSYEYDEEKKVYLRSQGTAKGDYEHIDYVTKEQYTTKNIITYQVKNYRLDSKDRQALNTVGGGTGYYITNGYAVPITWEKSSRTSQTVYRYLNGEEIKVNDGNTYIQIQPLEKELTIS